MRWHYELGKSLFNLANTIASGLIIGVLINVALDEVEALAAAIIFTIGLLSTITIYAYAIKYLKQVNH